MIKDLSNLEIIMLMYPKCRQGVELIFLFGTFLELVDKEVISKQKELLVNTLRGVLRPRLESNTNRAVPPVLLLCTGCDRGGGVL